MFIIKNAEGYMTVKYIYGPASVSSAHDDVIGSSLSGRIEVNVDLCRMTTIAMSVKGKQSPKPYILYPKPQPCPNPKF